MGNNLVWFKPVLRENEISQKMMSFNKAASSLEEKVAWLSQQECPRNLKFIPSYKLELYHVGRRKFSSLQYSQYVQLLQGSPMPNLQQGDEAASYVPVPNIGTHPKEQIPCHKCHPNIRLQGGSYKQLLVVYESSLLIHSFHELQNKRLVIRRGEVEITFARDFQCIS